MPVCLSVCLSVCPSVCVFTFEVPFKRLFAPKLKNKDSLGDIKCMICPLESYPEKNCYNMYTFAMFEWLWIVMVDIYYKLSYKTYISHVTCPMSLVKLLFFAMAMDRPWPSGALFLTDGQTNFWTDGFWMDGFKKVLKGFLMGCQKKSS